METFRFRAINYKGKREYVFDHKGTYIRVNGDFIKETRATLIGSTESESDKELKDILRNNPHVKNRVKGIKNVLKQIYYLKVWLLTEANDLTVLKNHEKRGFRRYNLDHIFPISAGFKEHIPPEAIADIKNLQFLPHRKNIKKGATIDSDNRKVINEIMKIRCLKDSSNS